MRYLLALALLGCSTMPAADPDGGTGIVAMCSAGDAGVAQCPAGYSIVCVEALGEGGPFPHWVTDGTRCSVAYGRTGGSSWYGAQLAGAGGVTCHGATAACMPQPTGSWVPFCVPDATDLGCP